MISYDLRFLRSGTLEHPAEAVTALHTHDTGQLCWVKAGLLCVETRQDRWVVPVGRLGWIPPDVPHASRTLSAASIEVLHLPPAMCASLPSVPVVFSANPVMSAVFARVLSRSQGGSPPETDETFAHLVAVLLDEVAASPTDWLRLPMPQDVRLRSLAKQLIENPGDTRSIAEWACEIGMTTRTLSRRFQAETHMQLIHWRQLARVMTALDWLAQGKPVGWVALSCGYNSISAFIEMFRHYMGYTPGSAECMTNAR